MKNLSTSFILLLFVAGLAMPQFLNAQSPEKLSYQAVIRNSADKLVANQTVGMKISIIYSTPTGTVVYAETQTPTTNANGLISIAIGTGTVVYGTFSIIEWTAGPHFIKTEIDPAGGTAYSITSTSELLSVPYALLSKDVQNKQWTESGSAIYFNTGKVGIGKNPGTDLRQFQVLTTDNQAIAGVNNSASYATIFAQNLGTGPAAEFRNNLKIFDGTQAAGKVLTSDANGYSSWQQPSITVDAANFTGNGSPATPLKLSSMGASTGQVLKWTGTAWDNAIDNDGPWGEDDNYIYNYSGKKFGMGTNKPTQKLTIVDGSTSCYMNIQNSTTGYTAISGLLLGMVGNNGWVSNYESGNLYLGTSGAARMTIASDGDVGIGIMSPLQKLDVNGAVNISGNSSDQLLFCGSAEAIWYNGTYFSWGYGGTYNYFGDKVTIGTSAVPGYNLVVNGTAAKTGGGSWSTLSDARMKDLTGEYQKGLNEILQLKPVTFTYKAGNSRELNSNEPQIGFVAQDVQKIFPEAVTECKDGYLDFNIHAVNVALVNAVKELKAENEQLKMTNEKYEVRLAEIENMLRELKKQ